MIFFNPSSTEILKKISFGYFFKLQYFLSAVDTFKQKSGVAMGSSISASLATIFVNLMEKTTVKKFIDEGKVISHLWVNPIAVTFFETETFSTTEQGSA